MAVLVPRWCAEAGFEEFVVGLVEGGFGHGVGKNKDFTTNEHGLKTGEEGRTAKEREGTKRRSGGARSF